jgi:hypothetical protein
MLTPSHTAGVIDFFQPIHHGAIVSVNRAITNRVIHESKGYTPKKERAGP